MLRSSLLVLTAAALAAAGHHKCICDLEAKQVGRDFGLLVSNYSDTLANNVLASTFSDQTDSVITLIDSASQPQEPIPVRMVPSSAEVAGS